MKQQFDTIIIGGGASGLMCAITAKRKNQNLNIAIIEKNDRVGKKLLSTGNGRCNLTNKKVSADKYTGSFQKKSAAVFDRYDASALIHCFECLGLLSSADSEGRYYPLCRQASAVLDVLRFHCENLGVEIFCGTSVKNIKKQQKFFIQTDNGDFEADKLVIAAGSKAAPKLGGNGSGTDYLRNFRHKIIPFSPALCPVKVQSNVLKSLKGLRSNAKVSLLRQNRMIKSEYGEVQFNEDNLSGICVFNLSLFTEKNDVISVDLLPNISFNELFDILLKNKKLFYQQTIDNLFTGILQKRMAQAVLKLAGIKDFSRKCETLTEKDIKNMTDTAKHMEFSVVENYGFDRAQAAKGGVLGSEIDEKTMSSKLCDNLYICGEMIDLCGECGGYNLHFAFASGIIAGENL